MKKSLLLFITLVSLSHMTYASFPVTEEINNSTEINLNNDQTEAGPDADWTGPDIDWTAFALCLTSGSLGVHRYYLGHNGIAYLQTLYTGFMVGLYFILSIILPTNLSWISSYLIPALASIWTTIDLIKIVQGKLYRGPLDPQFPSIDWTMLTLCTLGGLLGLHRFYKGTPKDRKIGLWQLLTIGGLGIWWLIDMVKILTGKLYK